MYQYFFCLFTYPILTIILLLYFNSLNSPIFTTCLDYINFVSLCLFLINLNWIELVKGKIRKISSKTCCQGGVTRVKIKPNTTTVRNNKMILPSEDQLSVKTFSGLEKLSLWPPSHDNKDIFKKRPAERRITFNILIIPARIIAFGSETKWSQSIFWSNTPFLWRGDSFVKKFCNQLLS